MSAQKRTLPLEEFQLHGTGDPVADTAALNRIVAAIERRGRGMIVSSGDVHFDDGAFVNATGGWKMMPGSKLHLYPGAYFGWGTSSNDEVLDLGTIPLTSNGAAGDHTIQVASEALSVGQYIAIAADNEYQTDYTRHIAGVESRPLMLRKIIRAVNSTTYELDKPLVDDLITNPRCQVVSMLKNVTLENFRWTHFDDSGSSNELYTDDYQGYHASSLALLNSESPGSDTNSWGVVRGGVDAGLYRWDGAEYVLERDLPTAAGLLLEKIAHLRMAGCEYVAPTGGSAKIKYVHDGLIEGLQYGEKFASWHAKSNANYGYGLLCSIVEKMRITSSNFDAARHCILSGGASADGHRYGNGALEVDNCKFYVNGGESSALPCDLHSELEGGVFRDNEFWMPETGNFNHAAISSRSRYTIMKGNDVVGPGNGVTKALRAFEPLGPGQVIEDNTIKGLAIGIRLKSYSGLQNLNGLKIARNSFEDLNHCALGIDDGVNVDFEFSHNLCHDVGHLDAGGSYFGGHKACIIFDNLSSGERRIYGNVMPKYRNDWAIHFGSVVPAGNDRIECNVMTGYGFGLTSQGHFGGDGSNVNLWDSSFGTRNWTDEFFEDFVAAVPAGTPYRQEVLEITTDAAPVTTTKQFSFPTEFALMFADGRKLIASQDGDTYDYDYDAGNKQITWDNAAGEALAGRKILVEWIL